MFCRLDFINFIERFGRLLKSFFDSLLFCVGSDGNLFLSRCINSNWNNSKIRVIVILERSVSMFRNRQWICNFIALLILLTGMCVDEVKADSVFLRPQAAAVVVGLETADAVISDVDIEPTQFLCARNSVTSSQIAAQITSMRRTIKLSMLLLCVEVFSLLRSLFNSAVNSFSYSTFSSFAL